jgi:hypothetical protein
MASRVAATDEEVNVCRRLATVNDLLLIAG